MLILILMLILVLTLIYSLNIGGYYMIHKTEQMKECSNESKDWLLRILDELVILPLVTSWFQ